MNFFEQQDISRRKTAWLLALFALAVVLTILAVYVVGLFVAHFIAAREAEDAVVPFLLWRPEVLLFAGGGSLVVIAGGTLTKMAQLRAGGSVVALQLGGRPLNASTTDPFERRLLNVVEEMAIASGTPVPPVYLLDNETGINAFAAGFEPAGAVIGVTRGAAERLSRDELQGVIAHEFSHILSGDMRLNIRLMGLLHGILVIGLIGHTLLRLWMYRPVVRTSRNNKDGGGIALIIAVGAALAVIGFIGTFFGNLIKAAVSRQHEFFADASAVQFTRNPSGIAGALRKIGGFAQGARVNSPNAPEASHMFFGRAVTGGLSGLFSTHPPLDVRIKRIDPSWDGSMLKSVPRSTTEPNTLEALAAFDGAAVATSVLDQIGSPTTAHLELARARLAALPGALRDASEDAFGARAVVVSLLLDPQPDLREHQLRLVAAADRGVFDQTARLYPLASRIPRELRLTLLNTALPALSAMTPSQDASFRELMRALIGADNRVDLFEFALQRIVESHLDAQQSGGSHGAIHYYALTRLTSECAILFSVLARAGTTSPGAAQEAFAAGVRTLDEGDLAFTPDAHLTVESLSGALDALKHTAPKLKRRLLESCAAVVAHDREVAPREGELLRAIADSLGVPTPPLLPGQRLA